MPSLTAPRSSIAAETQLPKDLQQLIFKEKCSSKTLRFRKDLVFCSEPAKNRYFRPEPDLIMILIKIRK